MVHSVEPETNVPTTFPFIMGDVYAHVCHIQANRITSITKSNTHILLCIYHCTNMATTLQMYDTLSSFYKGI